MSSSKSNKGSKSTDNSSSRSSQSDMVDMGDMGKVAVINLSDIISALEMTNDESCGYLDTETGQIKWQFDFDPSLSDISSEELEADEGDEGRKRYLLLPDRFEINEYHMIEAFAYDHDDHSGRLIRAIQGRGAFRRFRETVERLGLLDEWYEFRDNCYRERAVSWCHGHNLAFTEEKRLHTGGKKQLEQLKS